QIVGSLLEPDVEATRVKGKGNLIDSGVAMSDFVDKLRTHCGLALCDKGATGKWWHRKLIIPKELATPPKPKKTPDPDSRRTKKRRVEHQRAKARLETHLQETHSLEMLEETRATIATTQFGSTGGTCQQVVAEDLGLPGLSDELKAWGAGLIIRDRRRELAEKAATRICAEWVTRLEGAAIIADDVTAEAAVHYRGRGSGFEVRCLALRSNDADPPQQAKCLADAHGQTKALQQLEQDAVSGKKNGREARSNYHLDVTQIQSLVNQSE
ncbi:unnamed protein product, partial [Prorocentrum cordatum]